MRLELSDENINHLQRRTIVRTLEAATRANEVDIWIRKDGKDYRYEADWLKHLKFE